MKNSEICFDCEKGHYEIATINFLANLPNGESLTVPKVQILRCPECGDEVIPYESNQYIESFISEQTEQLSSEDLYNMFRECELDQTQFSEAIGLGAKTYHRWLKGTQVPSRSMGFYLRALAQFPEAFKWVTNRGWRNSSNGCNAGCATCDDKCTKFPAVNKKYCHDGESIKDVAGKIPFFNEDKNPAQLFAER
jgi:YgiT-type zinc finger domain-containing protein